LFYFGESGVNQLKRGDHVLVPGEEEADFGAAAAGGRAHSGEAGDGVNRVFDRLGDEDLHLFDGHDAVVDADDDAGEVGLGEDGDGYAQGKVDAGESEDDGEEEDGFGVASEPEAGALDVMPFSGNWTGMDGCGGH
jgi:hypothetical protein